MQKKDKDHFQTLTGLDSHLERMAQALKIAVILIHGMRKGPSQASSDSETEKNHFSVNRRFCQTFYCLLNNFIKKAFA